MTVQAIAPDSQSIHLLAGAQFADAFRVTVGPPRLTARTAAERMLRDPPRWIGGLLRLRNRIVAPFGLVAPDPYGPRAAGRIGIFPVMSETPDRLVLGLDDSHLDFRLVVDVAAAGAGCEVTATTVVLTHNPLGRAYLAAILPFHRIIVRTMLRRVDQPAQGDVGD